MTILQWCAASFRDFDPSQVADAEAWGNCEIKSAYLVSSQKTAALQVTCGGDCIIGFETTAINKRPLYLIRDNNAGHAWESEAFRGTGALGPKPHARLRLVQTA